MPATPSPSPAEGAYVRFYDFLVPHTDEVPHLLRLAGEGAGSAPARILDCGTGTGRLAVPLALAGHHVVGLDRSPSMLARAQRRWAAAAADAVAGTAAGRYEPVAADFTAPPADVVPPGRFDLVLFSSNTLALATREADQQAALCMAHERLRPGGRLVLEQLNPAGFFAEAFRQREVYHLFTRRNPATGRLTARYTSFLHDPVEQQVYATTIIEEFLSDVDAGSCRHMFVEHLRYQHVAELRLRLAVAGFAPEAVTLYGGHDREPLTARSLKLVVIATK